MKIKELKNKILIAELDPNADYILLVNPALTRMDTLRVANFKRKPIPIVIVMDVDKAVRFVEIK